MDAIKWQNTLQSMTTQAVNEWIDSADQSLDVLRTELSQLGYIDDYEAYDACRAEILNLNAMLMAAVRESIARDV